MASLVLPLAPRRPARRLVARAPSEAPPPRDAGQARSDDRRGAAPFQGERPGFVLLIVDDDPLMTDMLPRRLRRAVRPDVEIRTATTVEEAQDLIRALRPDAILSDYNLREERTGIDVLREAGVHAPHAARILFSGHTRREIRELEGADIHAYVEKPMRLDELIGPVIEAIARATGEDLREGGPRA